VHTVLLLGAGFSKNWGGCLAREVMYDVLGRIAEDSALHGYVSRIGNFEDALSQVQSQYKHDRSDGSKARLVRLQNAILETFNAMNQAFAAKPSMEFSNMIEYSIQAFLWKFDAIFTLNQDLLIEMHYKPELYDRRRRTGSYCFPGMQPPSNWRSALPCDLLHAAWHPMAQFALEANHQHIYKLHGSANWRDTEGGELLVMGADKQSIIRDKPILAWYGDEFRRHLEMPGTRLMVVGYGFRDQHIDDTIYEAWQRKGLQMFVVNTQGRSVFNKQSSTQIKVPDRMEMIPLIGISDRELGSTFGGDHFEYGKLKRFFDA